MDGQIYLCFCLVTFFCCVNCVSFAFQSLKMNLKLALYYKIIVLLPLESFLEV